MQKFTQHINPIGIQKDVSPAQAKGSQFVHDMFNKRITQDKESNTFAISSEGVQEINTSINVPEEVIGIQKIDKYIVYFSKGDTYDYISIYDYNEKKLYTLYGHFNFNSKYPIESIGIVETSDIIKVYWVDKQNYPRVLNVIKEKDSIIESEDPSLQKLITESTYFDFQPALNQSGSLSKIEVVKLLNGQGYFHSGIVQYALSYYNKNGQESPVFLQSDIFYITGDNRGLSEEEYSSNSFAIHFENLASTFWEYIRIYRIFRSSLNATPQVEIIQDIKISDIITETIEEEQTIVIEGVTQPMALSGPLKFTNSVIGNVVTIIYNGKAYSIEDNPDKQITDIFDNNYNLGLRTTYSGNITLLDGSVTQGIIFYQSSDDYGQGKKQPFVLQVNGSTVFKQKVLLGSGYYYILTTNNSGKLGDITTIGRCDKDGNEGVYTSIKEDPFGDMTISEETVYQYSGINDIVGTGDDALFWYNKSFTFIPEFAIDPSSLVPSQPHEGDKIDLEYTKYEWGGGGLSEGPSFILVAYNALNNTVVNSIKVFGAPKKKACLIYEGSMWICDNDTQATDIQDYAVFTGQNFYIGVDHSTGNDALIVPVKDDMIYMYGTYPSYSGVSLSIKYTCSIPIEAIQQLFVGMGSGKVADIQNLYLRVYANQELPITNLPSSTVLMFPDNDPQGTGLDSFYRLYSTTYQNLYSPYKKWLGQAREQEVITTKTIIASDFTDTGTSGVAQDPQVLIFKGMTNLKPYTLTHKDNTLFLGNYSTEGNSIDNNIKELLKSSEVTFVLKDKDEGKEDPFFNNYYYNFNLNDGSQNIKHFREGQVYRVGVQFLNKKGQWSEAVFLKDIRCNQRIIPNLYDDTLSKVPQLEITLNSEAVNQLSGDYIGARILYVEPNILDKNVICQGIACSTVYNFRNRFEKLTFSQASWFARPEFYGTEQQFFNNCLSQDISKGMPLEWRMVGTETFGSLQTSNVPTYTKKPVLLGLPNQSAFNSEIQGQSRGVFDTSDPDNDDYKKRYFGSSNGYILNNTVDNTDRSRILSTYYPEDFGIDRSIMTLHSPDIQWDESIKQIDLNSYKVRLIGFVPVKKTLSDIYIESKGNAYGNQAYGFIKNIPNDSQTKTGSTTYISGKGLITYPFWVDDLAETKTWEEEGTLGGNNDLVAFPIYPWHRNGALNNQGTQDPAGIQTELQHKILSNLRICLNPYYLTSQELSVKDKKIIIDNDFVQNYSLNYEGYGLSSIYYRGNEDTVYNGNQYAKTVLGEVTEVGYPINIYGFTEGLVSQVSLVQVQNNTQLGQLRSNNWGFSYNTVNPYGQTDVTLYANQNYINSFLPLDLAYGTVNRASRFENNDFIDNTANVPTINTFPAFLTEGRRRLFTTQDVKSFGNILSMAAISIKYKSGNHIVFSMNSSSTNIQQFPSFVPGNSGYSNYNPVDTGSTPVVNRNFIWQSYSDVGPTINWDLKQINIDSSYYGSTFYYYPVVELYKENIINQYGGTSQNALNKNIWIPISETFNLGQALTTTSGDTYFQRYDHLKTQPYTQEDQNSIVEIVSFPVETYINIDGRYDENRGKESNLVINKNNFNQLNQVYSQTNNYFNYNSYGDEKLTKIFPNQFTWSLEKIAGEEIDSWTNVTLLNTYDLDGDKGPLQYLERFNNQIYAFQDTGLARIIFNPRVQIPVSDGIPIEMGNSRKLEGVVYISDTVGNQNKWAIAKGKTGIYFLDKINNSFNKFNGERIESLSDQHFNKSFMLDAQAGIWDINNTAARLLYENATGDYYLRICIPKGNDEYEKYQLAYNENLGTFTSRYDYDMNFIYEIPPTGSSNNTESYFVTNETEGAIYKFNHNNTTAKESSITLIGNENFPLDKVFETVEFRANDKQAFGDVITRNPQMVNKPVYNISAKNGHQESNNNGDSLEQHFNTGWLRKKFRVWRAQIPRQDRDRIRDTWSYITLYSDIQVSLYDFGINYYI